MACAATALLALLALSICSDVQVMAAAGSAPAGAHSTSLMAGTGARRMLGSSLPSAVASGSARKLQQRPLSVNSAVDNLRVGPGANRGTPNPFRISAFGAGLGGNQFGAAGVRGGFQTRTGVSGGR